MNYSKIICIFENELCKEWRMISYMKRFYKIGKGLITRIEALNYKKELKCQK